MCECECCDLPLCPAKLRKQHPVDFRANIGDPDVLIPRYLDRLTILTAK